MVDRDDLIRFARSNRRDPGLAEVRLWGELSKRLLGFKFRRQDVIGPYIVDFSCRSKRLIIEVDDLTHNADRDAIRDRWLTSNGWTVLRIGDHECLENLDGVIAHILKHLATP